MITYLTRCILYLTRYKEVQEAAREEVERETGEERPSLKHQLPYCQAVIQEVQRLSCVAPQTIPHRWNTIPTGHPKAQMFAYTVILAVTLCLCGFPPDLQPVR